MEQQVAKPTCSKEQKSGTEIKSLEKGSVSTFHQAMEKAKVIRMSQPVRGDIHDQHKNDPLMIRALEEYDQTTIKLQKMEEMTQNMFNDKAKAHPETRAIMNKALFWGPEALVNSISKTEFLQKVRTIPSDVFRGNFLSLLANDIYKTLIKPREEALLQSSSSSMMKEKKVMFLHMS